MLTHEQSQPVARVTRGGPREKSATPTLGQIAAWWAEAVDDRGQPIIDLFAYIGSGEPFCFRCGWLAPVNGVRGWAGWNKTRGYLERAHLVDYCALRDAGMVDTEDGPANQVPLCHWCHRDMPVYGVGERAQALAWVLDGGHCPASRQLMSDALVTNGVPITGPGERRGEALARKTDRALARWAEADMTAALLELGKGS